MTLPAYDADVHHIGLGLDPLDGGEYDVIGFEVIGSYNRELQREATGAQDFGGSSDLLGHAQSLARVTQDDFTGGAYAREWVKTDAAQFRLSRGLMSQAQSKALATVPPLFQKAQLNPAAQTGYSDYSNPLPVAMFMVAGSIYICFNHGIMRYHIDSDDMDFAALYNSPSTLTPPAAVCKGKLIDASYDSNDQMIYALYDPQVADNKPYLARIKTDLTIPVHNSVWDGPAGTENLVARGFDIRDTGIVCAFGTHVWNGTPPKATDTVQDEVRWTEIGRLPGRWRDSVAYSGYDYILCTDGAYKTQLVAFDGTSILPITTFPFSFEGKCITEYAGRIYVGGVGTDVNGSEYYGELYEVTGASVRLIRSFSPETNREDGEWPHVIRNLSVFEGLLWMGGGYQSGNLIAYDITSDGLFGASGYPAASGADWDLYNVVSGRGRHWYWGHSASITSERGIYRVYQPGDDTDDLGAGYTPFLITSDFAWEPGVKKRWSQMRIHSRYVAVTLGYSLDGGDSFEELTATDTEQQGVNYFTTFDLSALPVSTSICFTIELPRALNVETFAELIAYTFTFHVQETGKSGWSFTVINADHVEGFDGSDQSNTLADVKTWLWDAANGKLPLKLTDVDGSVYSVQISAMREVRPVISPERSESHFAISLIEV